MSDGSAVRLTIARYYSPLGRNIQKPYSKGKAEYEEELAERFHNGEVVKGDTSKPSGKAYKTPAGRTVYGGGGITPDVFVPFDTTHMEPELLKMYYKGTIGNFEKDIYGALEQALPQLGKYHTLKIIVPYNTYHPQEILQGFTRFCLQYAFNYKVVHNIANEPIKEGEAYINLMEDDLVILIEKILATHMKLGKHVGLISYNETSLKKIILNGITTISTDFQMMGEKTAELILKQSLQHIEIPFYLTLRNSL